jgi:LAO/AO transport system kinase
VETVAQSGEGVQTLWDTVAQHRSFLEDSGELELRRADRLREELRRVIQARLIDQIEHVADGEEFNKAVDDLVRYATDPYSAADGLLD